MKIIIGDRWAELTRQLSIAAEKCAERMKRFPALNSGIVPITHYSLYKATGVWESSNVDEIILEMQSGTKCLSIHNKNLRQDKIEALESAGYSVSITPISTIVRAAEP